MKDRLELELTKKRNQYAEDIAVLTKFADLQKAPEKIPNSEISSNFSLIEDLGFTNSKCIQEKKRILDDNASFNANVRKAIGCMKFMKEVSDYFGPHTIVIKRSDMIDLIRKYDLKVGKFSDYLGTIPDINLQEIKEANDKIRELERDNEQAYAYPLLTKTYKNQSMGIIDEVKMDGWRDSSGDWHTYRLGSKLRRELNTFPIVQIQEAYNREACTAYYIRSLYSDYKRAQNIGKIRTHDAGRMFIIAPSGDMQNSKTRIKFSLFTPPTDDPFVCSISDYGVVIHSRWGREASDAAFEKYTEFFNKLRMVK